MREKINVDWDCVCGGKLIITGAPYRMKKEVDILCRWFGQEHRDHGTGGVREPRNPWLPQSSLSEEL